MVGRIGTLKDLFVSTNYPQVTTKYSFCMHKRLGVVIGMSVGIDAWVYMILVLRGLNILRRKIPK